MINAAVAICQYTTVLKARTFAIATLAPAPPTRWVKRCVAIRRGETDIVITGGSEAAITRMGLAAFQNMKALSTRNARTAPRQPSVRSRPRWLCLKLKAAGVLVFEELKRAKARGAKIYGEVIGYGTTSDAGHITAPDPEGSGAAAAIASRNH